MTLPQLLIGEWLTAPRGGGRSLAATCRGAVDIQTCVQQTRRWPRTTARFDAFCALVSTTPDPGSKGGYKRVRRVAQIRARRVQHRRTGPRCWPVALPDNNPFSRPGILVQYTLIWGRTQ